MKINPLNATLEQLIHTAKKLEWCVKYGCTTCGAREFRSAVKSRFTRNQLVKELKTLSADCVDDITNRDVLLLLMYEVVFLNNFVGLSSELAGTKAGEFLDRAIRIESERLSDTKRSIEKEKIKKKMKDQKNAQKNIWGAIKRNDMTAIPHLLSKNLDLSEIGLAGITLSEALKQIGLNL